MSRAARSLLVFLLLSLNGLSAYGQRTPEREEDAATSQSSGLFPSGPTSRQPPPLKSFPRQLLENFKGLASRHNLKPLLIGSAATVTSAFFDEEIRDYMSSSRRFKELGEVGAFLGSPLTIGVVSGGLLFSSYLTESQKFRSIAFSLSQGFVLSGAMTASLKTITWRAPPDGEGSNSFPSGHTSSAFTVATVLSHHYSKASFPAYLTAGLIGVSRLEKNKHFLSDVVAGATLGYIVGRTVVRGTASTVSQPNVTWVPLAGQEEWGIAMFLTF